MAADATHPGEHIAAELKVLDVDVAAFARQLQLPENRVTEILNRRQAITADVALRMADYFGTSAKFWVNLQRLHDQRIASTRLPRVSPRQETGVVRTRHHDGRT